MASGIPNTLRCDTHGKQLWLGTVVCAACSRPWQMRDEKADLYAPEVCLCGARLAPVKGDTEADFSARPACKACWFKLVRAMGAPA